MKKTFRSILAGALALLAVSCYDDSDLQSKYGDLNDRVSAIENTLNAEVGGINDLLARVEALEGKIAAIKVETDANGVTTLTLSDNSQVVLSQNGVVTVKEGVWYTVDPKTGAETVVGAVGHKIDFKVENGTLMYKPEGQAEYIATDVKVSDYTAHVIGNVVPAADGKSVAVTIGDQTLELPLVTSAVASLGLSRDSFYLYYGAEKTVAINAEGLEDIYVMNEPDGWRANIVDGALVVNAPTKKAVNADAAAAEGLVLVHATTAEGKCIVAKLEVSTGEGLSVSLGANGLLTIKNALVSTTVNRWTGVEETSFTNFFISFMYPQEVAQLEQMGKTYADVCKMYGEPYGMYGNFYNNYYNWFEDAPMYQEGVYEIDNISISVDQVAQMFFYSTLPPAAWVIYVGAMDEMNQLVGEPIELNYVSAMVEVAATEVTHNEIKLSVMAMGAEKYLVGGTDQATYLNSGMTFDEYMQCSDQMARGQWYNLKQGYVGAMGQIVTAEELEEGINLSEIILGGLTYDASYDMWVMPVYDHLLKPTGVDEDGEISYDASLLDFEQHLKPYVYTFKTNPLVEGNAAQPTVTPQIGYTKVAATITPAEGTKVYYCFMTPAQFDGYTTNEALFDYVMDNCYWGQEEEFDDNETGLTPGDARILVVVSISNDGKYSVKDYTLTTNQYPTTVSDDLTLAYSEEAQGYFDMTATLTPAEGATVYCDFVSDETLATSNYASDEAIMKYFVTRNPATSNVVKVSNLSQNTKRTLVVLLVSGSNYKVYKKEYTTKSLPYVDTITITLDSATKAADGTYTVVLNVTGASKVAWYAQYYSTSPSYVTNLEAHLINANTNAKLVDVVDGKATVTFKPGSHCLYAIGYNVDADGKVVELSKTESAFISKWTDLLTAN